MKNPSGKYITLLATLLTTATMGGAIYKTALAASDESATAPSATAPNTSQQNTPSVRPAIAEMPFQTLGIGTQSGCARPAKMLITNEREWRRIWAVHTGGATIGTTAITAVESSESGPTNTATRALELPSVDFSRQAVVVLLMGNSVADSWIEINQVVSTPSATVIFFGSRRGAGLASTQKEQETLAASNAVASISSGASRSIAPDAAENSAQPFHFAIIDKPVAPVRFNDLLAPNCPTCVLP